MMKKILAMLIVFVMLLSAVPVLAEDWGNVGTSLYGTGRLYDVTDLTNTMDVESLFINHKLTIVMIWNDTCGYCKLNMPSLQEAHEYFEANPSISAQVVGFPRAYGSTNLDAYNEVIESYGLTFGNYVSSSNDFIGILESVMAIPTIWIVDADGIIVSEEAGVAFRSLDDVLEYIEPWLEILHDPIGPPLAAYGDVDLDGIITGSDALLVLRYTMGMLPEGTLNDIQLIAADFDRNGTVNAADALGILRVSMGLISYP